MPHSRGVLPDPLGFRFSLGKYASTLIQTLLCRTVQREKAGYAYVVIDGTPIAIDRGLPPS